MPTKPKTTEPAAPAAAPEPEEEPLEAYEQRRKDLIDRLKAAIEERGAPPTTLVGKLALITGVVGQIRKSGVNTFHNYRYAKESDLVEAIRPMLSHLGIWVWWSLHADPEKGIKHHERLNQKIVRKGEILGEGETLTAVAAMFKFIDEDGTTTEPQLMMGYGDDNSDKGLYKALTGMEKYFLFKTFLVSTGDDPEADTRADQRAASREAQTQVRVQPSQRPATGHGGRQAAPSSPQVKQLGELLRAKGVKKSEDVLLWLGEKLGQPFGVIDGDPAATLSMVLTNLPAATVGKLVAGLRAEANGTEPPAEEPEANTATGHENVDEEAVAAVAQEEPEEAGPYA